MQVSLHTLANDIRHRDASTAGKGTYWGAGNDSLAVLATLLSACQLPLPGSCFLDQWIPAFDIAATCGLPEGAQGGQEGADRMPPAWAC